MAELLKGLPVAAAIDENTKELLDVALKAGVVPTLAIVRMGEKPDDIYYENAAEKKCIKLGLNCIKVALDKNSDQAAVEKCITDLSCDNSVHGILVLRPFPKHIDDEGIAACLAPEKDIDGITTSSLAAVFAGKNTGFAPCTARACVEVLKHYDIPVLGKKAVVIGRSLVIGKPVSMLLLKENATVTICHTKTANLQAIVKDAEIIVTSAGKLNSLTADMVSPGQVVIDVSMNQTTEGKMRGDAEFDSVSQVVSAITPVPGGVGSVTTSILLNNVATAAINSIKHK